MCLFFPFFVPSLALLFRLSFLVLCFSFLADGRFLFSGMFVWVEIKSRARVLCEVILFVVDIEGRGHIDRPMVWCISLFPKKLKNENPKKKILKIEKSKIQNLKKEKLENRQVMLPCLYNLCVFIWNFRFKAIFLLYWYKCPLCW